MGSRAGRARGGLDPDGLRGVARRDGPRHPPGPRADFHEGRMLATPATCRDTAGSTFQILSHLGFWCCKSEKQTYPFGTVEGLSFSELKLGHLGIWRIKDDLGTMYTGSPVAKGPSMVVMRRRGCQAVILAES
ncbi:uncharacterized protein LOC118530831 [Halichoerus grypus]